MSHPSTIGSGMVNATGSLVPPPTMLVALPRRLPGFEPLPKLLPQLLTLKLETLLKLPSDLIGVRYSDVKELRMYSPRLLLLVPREMTTLLSFPTMPLPLPLPSALPLPLLFAECADPPLFVLVLRNLTAAVLVLLLLWAFAGTIDLDLRNAALLP